MIPTGHIPLRTVASIVPCVQHDSICPPSTIWLEDGSEEWMGSKTTRPLQSSRILAESSEPGRINYWQGEIQ